mmetsp:Transcript_10174/g.42652  ORF Transcript_10174/g.42652 Transcript_10174/m.42652 type:complete len:143 (-) Transcript_10174:1641-2069(-)
MSVLGWAQSFPSLRTSAIKRCSRHGTRLRCSIESFHVPVLIDQVLELYEGRRFEVFVDGTIGAGGHASKLLSSCDIDLFIGLDQDEIALAIASERLSKVEAILPQARRITFEMFTLFRAFAFLSMETRSSSFSRASEILRRC